MKNDLNKRWWDNLDKIWKVELIQNLLDSPKYKDRDLEVTDIYELLEESDEVFDFDKIWYLIPLDPFDEFVGFLYEGRVIDNESDFNAQKYKHSISCIRIADSINICRELSESLIYQVKIEKGTLLKIEKQRGFFWYASKVEILKPFSCWDLLPIGADIFNGNIGIQHQAFIPEGLVFPKCLKGNLIFWECTLPSRISLPKVIEGNLQISYCLIPPDWFNDTLEVGNLIITMTKLEKGTKLPKKIHGDINFMSLTEFEEGVIMPENYLSVTAETVAFPADFKLLNTKLKTLTFEDCNLPESFEIPAVFYISMIFTEKTIPFGLKLPEKYTGILTFEACEIPSGLKLSETFDGHLAFKNMTLPLNLKLPDDFSGILEFRNVQIPDGFILPFSIKGTLKILNSEIEGRLRLPSNDGYDFELDKISDLSNIDIPGSVLARIKRLPTQHFE
jgi:hypothetical protein